MKIKSAQKRMVRSPEDIARIERIREKFQRKKPGLEECEELVPLGAYLEIQALLHDLKQQREAAGLTLADVSKRSGLDRAALSRLENGRQPNPTFATLFRYSSAIGKAIAWVVVDSPAKGNGKHRKRTPQQKKVTAGKTS